MHTPIEPPNPHTFPAWSAAWQDAVYLAVHGSHAYGLATDDSDLDLKGTYIPAPERLLGYTNQAPDQLEFAANPETPARHFGPHDATIFSIHKLCRLGAACNPNVVEMLFVEDRHVLKTTRQGERIRNELAPEFLSLRARQTFGEYARGQLRRMEHHRRWLRTPPTAPPRRADFGLPEHGLVPPEQRAAAEQAVQDVMSRWQLDLEGLLPHQAIALQSRISDYLTDITAATEDLRFAAAVRQVGIDGDLLEALRRERQFKAAVNEWSQYQAWLKGRNPKRAELERRFGMDTKHAMHLCRLMRTCRDLIVEGKLHVYRQDRDELLAIKRGQWSYEQLLEDVRVHGEQADAAIREHRSPLPEQPDEAAINRLCIELVQSA